MTTMRSHIYYDPRVLRMTKSAQCFWFKRSFAMPTSKQLKLFLLGFVPFRASQPNGLGCSEVTKSAQCFWFKCSFAMPTSKTINRFWNLGCVTKSAND